MRTIIAFGFLFHIAISTYSQIHISMDQIWEADTIIVDQNIIIDEGVNLTINPGTIVFFVAGNYIDVYGQIEINGSVEDSVIMTSPDTTWIEVNSKKRFYGWGGIYVYDQGVMKAKYTIFEKLGYSLYSKLGFPVFGVLRNESSNDMIFEHCRFSLKRDLQQASDGCSIEADNATIVIKNSAFINNKGAGNLVSVSNFGALKILNTNFSNNDILGSLIFSPNASYQIESCRFESNKTRSLLNGGTFHTSSSVEQNVFQNNLGAVYLKGVYSTIYFRNNIFSNNGGQIYFELGNNIITGNVFFGNYYEDIYNFFGNDYEGIVRIENTELSGPVIINNSFINNHATALRMWSVNVFNIENNIFHNNYPSDISPENLESNGGTFQFNLLEQSVPGSGNNSGNPRLNKTETGFTLVANSPAIDNGSSTYADYLLVSDIMGNPRFNGQIDIGAVEFMDSYVPLTDVSLTDSIVARIDVGQEVARFTTTSQFNLNEVTYNLIDDNGVNNDYFRIDGDKLLLEKELSSETLLRIKLRVNHQSGAWLEEYYYLTVEPVILSIDHPNTSKVSIFPVPAEKFLKVDHAEPGMMYSIFSYSGNKLAYDLLTKDYIDISGLKNGIYFLKLKTGSRVDTFKFYKREL